MKILPTVVEDFEQDCRDTYGGIVLTGKERHWCPDWDFLPIDETCEEFKACHCPKEHRS